MILLQPPGRNAEPNLIIDAFGRADQFDDLAVPPGPGDGIRRHLGYAHRGNIIEPKPPRRAGRANTMASLRPIAVFWVSPDG